MGIISLWWAIQWGKLQSEKVVKNKEYDEGKNMKAQERRAMLHLEYNCGLLVYNIVLVTQITRNTSMSR